MSEKKTRLLFITYTHSKGGGAENILTTLVNNLDRERYDITIQEVEQYNIRKEPLSPHIRLLRPFIRYGKKTEADIVRYLLRTAPQIFRYLHSLNGYDAVISWNYQQPSFCLRGFPSERKIAWFHGDLYDIAANPEGKKDLQQMAWNQADRIVTISEKSYTSLKDIFPYFISKCRIVHNAIDIVAIQRKAQFPITDGFEAFNNEIPILVSVGCLDDNKNQQLLLEAVSVLKARGMNCFVFIIGNGKMRTNLEELAVSLGLSDYVQFTGYQDNPYPYMNHAKLLCVTSFSEGFPTVGLEAMALGKPFVTTPVSGTADELAAKCNCGLVSSWDSQSYANAIQTLLIDKQLYETLSINCLETVKEFSIPAAVRKFNELIDSVEISSRQKIAEKPENFEGRMRAILTFAKAWSFNRYSGLSQASQRFIKAKNVLNLGKIVYRLSLVFVRFIVSPVIFIEGLFIGYLRGVKR